MYTIFSSASNAYKSAIKIIRVSGSHAKELPEIFSFKVTKPRVASIRKLYDLKKKIIDHALVIFFPGPKTVTGEDLFELHIHGSSVIEKKIYNVLCDNNKFRIAEKGEFTRRAFLNGVIDLTQAEALNDLINSETENQFKASISQYGGALSKKTLHWRNEIIHSLAKLETLIDFADEELPRNLQKTFHDNVVLLLKDMKRAIKFSSYGTRLRSGFVITLIGRPNVGKSSLVNYLSNKKIAIVTNQAGTTRDVLEVTLDFEGFPIILNDTAGIRKTSLEVEKIGINKALEKAKKSDIILILSDKEDFSFPELKPMPKVKKILVHTKCDLAVIKNNKVLNLSVKKDIGINKLVKTIVDYLKTLSPKEDVLLTKQRHIKAVKEAIKALSNIIDIDLNKNPELAAEHLRIAAKEIGKMTNLIDVEEILDDIFSNFCIGK